jgi:hypothetical protein
LLLILSFPDRIDLSCDRGYNLGVFQFVIAPVLSALASTLPIASTASEATIEVCFAPEEDCAGFAERAIEGAEREILVSAYRLTVGSGIVGALIRAKERGVDVQLMADREAPCGRASGIEPLAAPGVPVWIDDRARIAHAKTMVSDSGGAILLGAGIWQLTPIKGICLRHCRSPLSFLAHKWRPGWAGAFRMGLEHGTYCLGCCWFLMGLLFFGGIMNLFWIAGLAAYILLEKTIPMGHWIGRAAGIGLAGWGVLMIASAVGGG